MAEEIITYNVKNSIGAWRKLYHQQLREMEHQKQLLMNEFNNLDKSNTIADMKIKIQSIERIIALWTEKADQSFDENHKLSKLRTIIPANLFQLIAIEAKKVSRYEELVQLIETQIMDPITGLARGDRNPILNAFVEDEQTPEWNPGEFVQYLASLGMDPNSPEIEQIVPAMAKA